MRRSIKTTETPLARDHYRDGHARLMAGEYAHAVECFNKALSLGFRDPICTESKISALLRLSRVEEAAYKDKRSAVDGSARYSTAHRTAMAAVQKWGKERWQPHYLLAEVVLHSKAYSASIKHLETALAHPSLRSAAPAQRAKVDVLLARARDALRLNTLRVRGRDETAAVERDLIAEMTTDRTGMLPDDVWVMVAQMAARVDDRAAARLSGVNRRLRGIMLGQRGLWMRLTLGGGKVLQKAKMFVERSGGVRDEGDDEVVEDIDVDPQAEGQESDLAMGRRGGGLRELVLRDTIPEARAQDTADLLADHVGTIDKLVTTRGILDSLQSTWRGKFASLRILEVASAEGYPLSPVFDILSGLVPSNHRGLRELSLTGNMILPRTTCATPTTVCAPPGVCGCRSANFDWTMNQDVVLAQLEHITLTQCSIRFSKLGLPVIPLSSLLTHMPKLRSLRTDSLPYDNVVRYFGRTTASPAPIVLDVLETAALVKTSTYTSTPIFETIHAPNLRHLDLGGLCMDQSQHHIVSPTVRANLAYNELISTGLAEALPRLRSLELARTTITDDQLLEVLRLMPELEYLGVACTLVTNKLICALGSDYPRDDTTDAPGSVLVPKLVALSVAGMPDLSSADLRDMVNARLPPAERIAAPGRVQRPRAKSAFGPSRGMSATPGAGGAGSSSTSVVRVREVWGSQGGGVMAPKSTAPLREDMAAFVDWPATPAPILGATMTMATTTGASTSGPEPEVARLRWLNVDNCSTFDPLLLPALNRRIGFVSAVPGEVSVPDRTQGKGRWDWTMDHRVCSGAMRRATKGLMPGDEDAAAAVAAAEEKRCKTVQDAETGKWFIRHRCGVDVHASGPGYIARSSEVRMDATGAGAGGSGKGTKRPRTGSKSEQSGAVGSVDKYGRKK